MKLDEALDLITATRPAVPAPAFDANAWLDSFVEYKVADANLLSLSTVERDAVRDMVFAWLRGYTGGFEFALDAKATLARKGQLSIGLVRGVLNTMRAERARARRDAEAGPVTFPEPGTFHLVDGQVFKAVAPKNGGDVYLKVLVPGVGGGKGRWEYAGRKAIYDRAVTATSAITVEQAAEHGLATGVCVVCGAELTDELSVSVGIGPVCVKKWGTTQRRVLAAREAQADPAEADAPAAERTVLAGAR